MSDTIKIKLYLYTGFAGAKHEDIIEVERDRWESLSQEEQERELDEMARDYMQNHIDCGAYVMEEDEE
jgi:hypothetical protein